MISDARSILITNICNKPYEVSNTLHWHQDVAYFPLKPNNQIAVWFPLEAVDKQAGALNYAIGSHKEGIKGSTDLHTRKPFDNENRDLIPQDPAKEGYEVKCKTITNLEVIHKKSQLLPPVYRSLLLLSLPSQNPLK